MVKKYVEIKNKQPELFECFFAFSLEQFEEGKKKAGIGDKKILSGGHGLYGTQEGIKKLLDDYANIDIEIAKQCEPQEVYAYEWYNHECSITNDDEQPMNIVVRIFGKEKAKTVKRKYGYIPIE
jgi:hypothetical protein